MLHENHYQRSVQKLCDLSLKKIVGTVVSHHPPTSAGQEKSIL